MQTCRLHPKENSDFLQSVIFDSPSVIPDIVNRESSVFIFFCVREEKDSGFLLSQE